MDEKAESAGLSRRDVLKRSAVVGGVVWVAPTVLTSAAGASETTWATCPANSRFVLKHSAPDHGCEAAGTNPSPGNCAASDGCTEFRDACCLEAAGLITFTQTNPQTHTYVLASGVALAGAFGKCGYTCFDHEHPHNAVVSDVKDAVTGRTTVTITCTNLSHSEIVVCFTGSQAPNCP